MLLNATLWLTVTHRFKGNQRKLADCSKSVCITLGSCFCSLLTSKWEVSTGHLLCSFLKFVKSQNNFFRNPYIKNIETNRPVEKHTLRVFTRYFEKIVSKKFVSMLHLCVGLELLHFVSLIKVYAVERNVVASRHTYI